MTRFIIVRHGQSEANKAAVFVGHRDADLSELGREQARLVSEQLISSGTEVDRIYASDLRRAYNTVSPYAERTGKAIIRDRFLREIFAGKWEGNRFDDLPLLYPESFGVWQSDIGECRPDGGESVKELYERINGEIDRIGRENDGRTILIGTHATPIRCIIARALGVGYRGMQSIGWVGNASLNLFELDGGVLTANKLDEREHLGALHSEFSVGQV